MELKKADLYYGSLLSLLVNNGLTPAILEQGEKRNIYKVSTNKGDYKIFSKYRVLSKENSESLNWQFSFSEAEIEEIRKLEEEKEKLILGFVCINDFQERFKSELALLYPGELKECLYIDEEYEGSQRLNIKYKKGNRGLNAYGIKRADYLNEQNNKIRVERDRLIKL